MDELEMLRQRVETLTAELTRVREVAAIDVQNAQTEALAAKRENTRLKRELNGLQDEDSPEAKEVLALLKLWKREIRGDCKNVKADLKSTRAPVVRAAIKRRGVEVCRKAVLGVQFDDFAMGRIPRTAGKPPNDIAKHLLKDDSQIDKWAALFDDRFVTAPEVFRRMVEGGWRPPAPRHPMRIALEGLRELGCGYKRSDVTDGLWMAQCPLHEDLPWSLMVRMAWGRCRMLCAQGCDEYTVLVSVGFVGPSDWTVRPHAGENGKVTA
jgi:hypothetical protein